MAAASKLIPVVGTLAYSASVFAQQASESLPLGVPQQGGGAVAKRYARKPSRPSCW